MGKNDNHPMRVYQGFEDWLRKISAKRVDLGKDKMAHSPQRMTKALIRCPEINLITERLLKADINKKGQVNNLFGGFFALILFIVIAIAVVLLFSIFQYGFNTMTTSLVNVPSTSLNFTQAAQTTFGNVNLAINQFTWWSYVIIFGMVVGFFFGFYLVTKVHPGFFALWVIFVAIAVMVAIGITSGYESIYNSGGVLGTTLQDKTISSFMILNLPIIVTVIGFIGGIFMFIGINRAVEDVGGF